MYAFFFRSFLQVRLEASICEPVSKVAKVSGFGDVVIEFAHVAFAEVPGGDSGLPGTVFHAAFPAGPARVVSSHSCGRV